MLVIKVTRPDCYIPCVWTGSLYHTGCQCCSNICDGSTHAMFCFYHHAAFRYTGMNIDDYYDIDTEVV